MKFLTSYGFAVLVVCSLPIVRSEAQIQPNPSRADVTAISGSWAVGVSKMPKPKLEVIDALLGPDASDAAATVCDYDFADIAGDGFYRLLVSVDYSGRRWCNTLEIIANDGTTQELSVWNVEHIRDVVVKDGVAHTLRVPQALTDYDGTRCIAIVPTYYTLSGTSLVNSSAEHVAFYKTLQEKLSSAQPMDACSVIVVDKIGRILGNLTSGFNHAKAWMESSDTSLREKAVRVFEDIGDLNSQAELRVLASDKNPIVSMEALAALRSIGRR